MNWLFAVVVVILLGFAYKGHKRGFIRTILSICAIVVALVMTVIISPIVSQTLCNNEQLVSNIAKEVGGALQIEERLSSGSENQEAIIDSLPLPKTIRTQLQNNNTQNNYQTILAQNLSDYICRYIAIMVLNAISFVLVFIIIRIILRILIQAFDIVSKLPIINDVNELAGMLLGLLEGIILLWVGCIILTMFSGSALGQEMYQCINENSILAFIYNNNLIMKLLMNAVNGTL